MAKSVSSFQTALALLARASPTLASAKASATIAHTMKKFISAVQNRVQPLKHLRFAF
jgi:hypothetical protein